MSLDLRVIEPVPVHDWREAVARAMVGGARPLTLYERGGEVRVVLARGAEHLVLSCRSPGGEVESLLGLAPWLEWPEREVHDLSGIRFAGHEPCRPLVTHDLDLSAWTTPVVGEDAHQVAVGPIHAGVIESGHFRFHVVGERILHVDLRLFYARRGLERAAEHRTLSAGVAVAQRLCAACSVSNTVVYAQACEDALGWWPDRGLARSRTLLLELERLYNHLHDIGQVCAGVGFAAGAMAFLSFKERAQRLNARLTGHRFLFDTVHLGGSALRIDEQARSRVQQELVALEESVSRAWRDVRFSGSVQDRLDGVGLLTPDWARRLGTVGPSARASGASADARLESPRLAYQGFAPVTVPGGASGDVRARVEIRAAELTQTFAILGELLSSPIGGGRCSPTSTPKEVGVSRVECPRGETTCVVEVAGDRVGRLHVRTASNANWRAVAHAASGEILPDFPLVNKSFELCYACSDR